MEWWVELIKWIVIAAVILAIIVAFGKAIYRIAKE